MNAYNNGSNVSYVPAIRWKRGEIKALDGLIKKTHARGVAPLLLIDNFRERKQHEKRKIPSVPKAYIDHVANEMLNVVGADRKGFVDTHLFDGERTGVDGLACFFENMTARLSALVPVLKLSDKAKRRTAIKERVHNVGAAIRIGQSDVRKQKAMAQLLTDLGAQANEVDLILDLGLLESKTFEATDILGDLGKVGLGAWRSIILLAGSYPKTLPRKPVRALAYERREWTLYKKTLSLLGDQEQRPIFGDYGIINPEAEPTSGSSAGGGTWPIIRYCLADSWNIFKASQPVDSRGISMYYELARHCATDGNFMGGEFSPGDGYICDRAIAKEGCGEGNSTSYIAADMNHHLTYVAAQIRGERVVPQPLSVGETREPTTPVHEIEEDYW